MTTKLKYTPTNHAINRAKARYGISAEEAPKWIDNKMRGARYIEAGRNGTLIYEKEGVRMIVNADTKEVVTLHHEISIAFLKPVLDREIRKLERQHTKEIRSIELDKAMLLKEYGKMAVNHANARNPKTRDLIKGRMDEVMTEVNELETSMSRISSEYRRKIEAIEMMAE